MNLNELSSLDLQNNNLINEDTAYDAAFITWLDEENPDWRTQISPSYCSLLQFSATNYNINEGDGAATITVTRTENSLGAVSLEYATSDETATAPNDYSQTTGTLNWADGDTADKTFTVDIIDDSEPESDETFSISLGNPTGGAELGEPAVVTITDNNPIQKTLTVTKTGTGSGTVISSPTGINCGTDCSHDYNQGTSVTLTATPVSGSTFTGWSGSCSGTSCSVTMSTNQTVNANFVLQTGSICDTVTEIPSAECEALVTLYNSTDGDNWTDNTGWKVTNTPCNWYGVSCSGGQVSQLSLSSNQLSGPIPPELGDLLNLKFISLSANQLSGPIPPELGNLIKLETLYLYNNQLCGKIPDSLMNLTALYDPPYGLKLQNNNLINYDTAYDANLIAWLDEKTPDWRTQISPSYCGNNQTLSVTKSGTGTGTITSSPTGINCGSDCTEDYNSGTVVTLTATPDSGSKFTGWSGNCSGTNCTVTMDTNHTVNANFEPQTGSICDTVTDIPSAECEVLVTLYNSTDGDNWTDNTGWKVTNTPCNWYGVSCSGGQVSQLSLSSNQLSGGITAELAQLSRLENLSLDFNQLSGPIPPELGDLLNLKFLSLSANQLSGPIPPELGNLIKLETLYLYNNQLCGKIPDSLMNLTALYDPPYGLKLQNNNLINDDTAYPADLIAWLSQKEPDWRTQVSPSYCTINPNDLVIDFGPQYGIWAMMNNDTWADIHPLSSINLNIGDIDGNGQDDIIIDFVSPNGIWLLMNNSTWDQLHTSSAESMTTGDLDGNGLDDVIIDFGSETGILVWMNNNIWDQLHTLSAESMTTGDMDGNGLDDVIIDFGSETGILVWMNNSEWAQLHSLSPESMTTGDMDGNGLAEVIIDFGGPYGIWLRMNNSGWTQLHSLSAQSMTTGDMDGNGLDEVIIDFGEPYGIWLRMNNNSWVKLHSLSPESMTTGYLDNNALADVIIDFGSLYGIWVRMNNDSWVKLHSISAESMVTGNIDGLPSVSSNTNTTTQEIPAAELDNAVPLPEMVPISLPIE